MLSLATSGRVFVGIIFVVGATAKVHSWTEFVQAVRSYDVLPRKTPVVYVAAISVVALEFTLGVCLFIGAGTTAPALLAMALLLSFSAMALRSLFKGQKLPNCGCMVARRIEPVRWTICLRNGGFGCLLLPSIAPVPPLAAILTGIGLLLWLIFLKRASASTNTVVLGQSWQ